MPNEGMSVVEAAKLWSVSRMQVYRWIADRRLATKLDELGRMRVVGDRPAPERPWGRRKEEAP